MLPPALKHASVECTAACPAQFDHPVPAGVRALRWSCEDDCKWGIPAANPDCLSGTELDRHSWLSLLALVLPGRLQFRNYDCRPWLFA